VQPHVRRKDQGPRPSTATMHALGQLSGYRPGDRFRQTRCTVNPKGKISLQSPKHRANSGGVKGIARWCSTGQDHDPARTSRFIFPDGGNHRLSNTAPSRSKCRGPDPAHLEGRTSHATRDFTPGSEALQSDDFCFGRRQATAAGGAVPGLGLIRVKVIAL